MKKLIYLLIVFLLCSSISSAQDIESSESIKVPMLNGHKFVSSSYFRSSFVTTSLSADIGFGQTSVLKIPGLSIGDYELLTFKGRILYVDLNVRYQQRFTPWLSLFINIKMAGRVGTSMSTIIANGINTIAGSNIGWLVRIHQTNKFNLAGTISVNKITGNFINVADYFEELINDEPYPSVMKKVPSLTAGIGIRGAYAFNPMFGLQFNTDFAHGESLVRGKSTSYFTGGILGDVDFYPKSEVPIGLAFGYALSTAPEVVMNDGGYSNLLVGKIGYTGSQDFELGVQFSYGGIHIKGVNDKASITKVLLSLKFYF